MIFEVTLDPVAWSSLNVYRYIVLYTWVIYMRTNIVIDDELMANALKMTGLKTKREAVELGLKTLVRLKQQEQIRQFRGKLPWKGDLEKMRSDN
jgi:Arc/MetJ family transcription regulator